MLTHGQVIRSLEQIAANVKVIPDVSSSSRPEDNFDITDYWQFFITTRKSNTGTYVATLYNENYRGAPKPELSGTVYAIVERENPETCNVPQKEIDLLTNILVKLTDGEVYSFSP